MYDTLPVVPASDNASLSFVQASEPEVLPTAAPQIPDIYAYIKEITPNLYNSDTSATIDFDILLGVSCDGKQRTIVKKIAFSKCGLMKDFNEAEIANITVIEEKIPALSKKDASRLRTLCDY